MTKENSAIPYFDETRIGADVKRLAFCFNTAAENNKKFGEASLITQGIGLFTALTGQETLPALREDDVNYLRLQFIGIAAKLRGDRSFGWQPYAEGLSESAAKLEKAAAESGLSFKPAGR